MTVKTEDLGKQFEMAVCLVYGIEYDGKYKYGLEEPEKYKKRLRLLPRLFPLPRHTAKRGARYDFTAVRDETEHLSIKTTKGDGKVAPQVIGQPSISKFRDVLKIPDMTVPRLKEYIQLHIADILPILEEYTFDCPNVYYNKKKNMILYVVRTSPINWSSAGPMTWTRSAEHWENSSTLKIDGTAILEMQFHTASRSNMANRWNYEALLLMFPRNFEIVSF